MMVTDNGFYYYSCGTDLGYHYCDRTTKRPMYLCNKPECRHDGNEFCVATNARYYYLDECIYSEKLFLYALEVTETQYLFKLLAAELDGSAMNEVATITTLEKTEGNISIDNCGMIIHRNTAMLEVHMEATDILGFQTDGEYFYFPELVRWLGSTDEEGNQYSRLDKAYVHVFNKELEEIAVVDLALEFPIPGFEETEWTKRPFTIDLHYCGEEIFWTLSPQENMAEDYIFCCKRSDFLAGTPEFTFVCRREQ